MIKNTLYLIATILLVMSGYFIFDWYKAEPNNKEPLPALISLIATIILAIIAWRFEGNKNNYVKVSSIEDESLIDIDPKKEMNVEVKDVKGKSKVFIGKGKGSLK